jgi:Icc-related predicted phosphoesterase
MRIVYSSDLHGNEAQYAKLFLAAAEHDADALLIGGDIAPKHMAAQSFIEAQRRWYATLGAFLSLHHRKNLRTQVFVMMGNDDASANLPELHEILERNGAFDIHGSRVRIGDTDIVGYSYVPPTPFGIKDWELRDVPAGDPREAAWERRLGKRWYKKDGFRSTPQGWVAAHDFPEISIAEQLRAPLYTKEPRKTVFVFHSPPIMTKLDLTARLEHVGSIAVRGFIERHRPLITLHGHVHETVRVSGAYHERIGRTHCYASGNTDIGDELAYLLLDTAHGHAGKRFVV